MLHLTTRTLMAGSLQEKLRIIVTADRNGELHSKAKADRYKSYAVQGESSLLLFHIISLMNCSALTDN